MTEVDVGDDRARRQIDNQHLVPSMPGFADTGAAIDRHKRGMSIRGGRDFMAMNPGCLLCDRCHLLRRRGSTMLTLVSP